MTNTTQDSNKIAFTTLELKGSDIEVFTQTEMFGSVEHYLFEAGLRFTYSKSISRETVISVSPRVLEGLVKEDIMKSLSEAMITWLKENSPQTLHNHVLEHFNSL